MSSGISFDKNNYSSSDFVSFFHLLFFIWYFSMAIKLRSCHNLCEFKKSSEDASKCRLVAVFLQFWEVFKNFNHNDKHGTDSILGKIHSVISDHL